MWQKFLWTMLGNCMSAATPEIVENIRRAIDQMVQKAKLTPNPWDDMLAGLLQNIVGQPKEPVERPDSND